MPPLNSRIRNVRKDDVRQRVSEYRQRVAIDIHHPEKQIDQRNGQKNKARKRKQKMGGGIEITQPLRKRKPAGEQWIFHAQDLHHAARPADALPDMRCQALGRESGRLRDIDVRCIPAPTLHAQGCVGVFGDRLHCNSADLIKRFAAQHRT